jgi:VIT1/CCC1 family predicted Fe2+/Mn2+ transporter
MNSQPAEASASALDPVYRSSEVIFGLLMAMSFIGSVSVATDGREEVRTLLVAALGCNLAWGLVDAVMHLVAITTQKRRNHALRSQLQAADAAAGRALLVDELPELLAAQMSDADLEPLRKRIVEAAPKAHRASLAGRDFGDAVVVFFLVVLSTFPVVIPFMLIDDTARALLWSRLVALAMLFLAGATLARYSNGNVLLNGLAMAAIGAVLMGAIMALGG